MLVNKKIIEVLDSLASAKQLIFYSMRIKDIVCFAKYVSHNSITIYFFNDNFDYVLQL